MTAFAPLASTPLSAAATAVLVPASALHWHTADGVALAGSLGVKTIVARDSTDASGRILARHG